MASIEIRKALPEDVPEVAGRMREEDRREIWAASLSLPEEALERSFTGSGLVWTVLIDGRPEAMFGVAPMSVLGNNGTAWLLGTSELGKIPKTFMAKSRVFVSAMLEVFPVVINFVDQRNAPSLRWLRWLGAQFGEAQPYGALGLPFIPFEMRR